ncbi:MAG: Ig-like domain repeat protein [Kouleothrix sp.]|nr:Ig-like domain repeat protein [Kouleothrix sp.]
MKTRHVRLQLLGALMITLIVLGLGLQPTPAAAAAAPGAGLTLVQYRGPAPSTRAPAAAALQESCSSGAHTLSHFGDRVYPEMGNGGYTSLHTDLYISYDTATNLFLPGTHADLTQQATQCLTDFSLDFERTNSNAAGPNFTVSSVAVDGQPAAFAFVQPTYPGDPNGQDDPDPLAHAVSNANPVSATNPNPPACSPSASGNAQNGTQCPANKLVITPASPIPSGASFTVSIGYTGRPGVHVDGDGSTEGWFRVNTTAAPNDGSFVTTEPVGNMAWMPLNNHPSAKPTYDIYDTVNAGKTAIANGELITSQLSPPTPTSVNPPDANFPAGSWTWHWHSPEGIPSYLVTNNIGSYDLTVRISAITGIQYYEAMASGLTAARKTTIKAVLDTQEDITQFQAQFNGPFPFTTNGVIVALPSVGFAEEMQTKITFGNGATSTPSVGTFHHENMHQWWGDNVSEAAFNLTFWKEGWATVGEYLNTARTAANAAGGLGTPAGDAAFDASLNNRFNTNYNTTSNTFWTVAPSNPTVANLFTTANTYTRPGTAYLALRQILGKANFGSAMRQIQTQYGGGSITEAQLEAVFHQWMPDQSPACSTRLDQFFTQWFDTAYPSGGGANKPQITGPGLAGAGFGCGQAIQIATHAPASATYGASFTVAATGGGSGNPVTFSSAGSCTNVGAAFTMTSGTGACTVRYDQAGSGFYAAAPQLTEMVAAQKAGQTIDFPPIPGKTYGDADFAPSATASSGLAVSYSAAGSCAIVGGMVHISGAGSCAVTASQPGNSNYSAAPDVAQSFDIAKAGQTIAFGPLAPKTFADPPFGVGASASSGLPVSFSAAGSCTVSGSTVTLTGVGSCTITASQPGDDNYNPAPDVARTFSTASAATTTTVSANPASVQYSDATTLRAVVSPASANGDTATGAVEFFINGVSVGSAPIDASGVAIGSTTIAYAPGSYSVTATFTSSSANFAGSSGGPAALTVTQEDARATYSGNSLFWTSSATSTSANVTLSATIQDITAADPASDGSAGDIRNARVTFINRDTNTPFTNCSNLPIGLVGAGDAKTGAATCSTTLSAGNTGATQYTVGFIVSGYYARNASTDNDVITVAQPLTSSFITGGGSLLLSSSSGLKPGTPGSKSNFGFNVKYNKSGTNLQGSVNIIVRSGGRVYQIKGNAISSLGVAKPKANFTGKASIQDITNPLSPSAVDGNATLQLWMTDNGEPGSMDTLGIQVLNKSGGTWFSSNWSGTKTVEQALGGGNLSVR